MLDSGLNAVIYKYSEEKNDFYIMREDLLPYSFGGNKVRKNFNYFKEILSEEYKHVVTYGSKSSNHARIVANLSAQYNLKCTIITPEGNSKPTFNTFISNLLKAKVIYTPLNNIKETINKTMGKLSELGEKPYFIQGGAHGLLGTSAYIEAFYHISNYSNDNNFKFDYIFLASGTGATQAGLVVGNDIEKYSSTIVGISVARESLHGSNIIKDSIEEYYKEYTKQAPPKLDVIFTDDYLTGGYGKYNTDIEKTIENYLASFGIPLDPTYTGKAVYGMHRYLEGNNIKNKKILFIHTGGTPLYFNYLKESLNQNA